VTRFDKRARNWCQRWSRWLAPCGVDIALFRAVPRSPPSIVSRQFRVSWQAADEAFNL